MSEDLEREIAIKIFSHPNFEGYTFDADKLASEIVNIFYKDERYFHAIR